jgi:Rrf2 family transcriptional regulator, cysteine metabolism repressor
MRLSTRSRYGVRLMLALAHNTGGTPLFLKDIARAEDISEKYLSQIIIPLKAHGLVTTFRGAHGGYLLGRPAAEITLKDIIEPLEGDLGLVECVANSGVCVRSSECITRGVWTEMSSLLLGFLESITLEELLGRHAALAAKAGGDFSI